MAQYARSEAELEQIMDGLHEQAVWRHPIREGLEGVGKGGWYLGSVVKCWNKLCGHKNLVYGPLFGLICLRATTVTVDY